MPELPEVQTIVNDLNRKVAGRKIVGVWLDWPMAIKYPASAVSFKKVIKGARILKIERRAKYIKIFLSGDCLLVFHLKMTGHFLLETSDKKKAIRNKEQASRKYIHMIFYLDNGDKLLFHDVRKFGTVRAGKTKEIENLPELKSLGPEPLDPSLKLVKFIKSIKLSRRKIKQVLMDPKIIAGIGNIYSDEALWLAKIHPLRRADGLSVGELKGLFMAIKQVLKKSLRLRGTSARDYRDTAGKKGNYFDQRLVYRREGEFCRRRDGGKIKRIKIGGRSAHFCLSCQK